MNHSYIGSLGLREKLPVLFISYSIEEYLDQFFLGSLTALIFNNLIFSCPFVVFAGYFWKISQALKFPMCYNCFCTCVIQRELRVTMIRITMSFTHSFFFAFTTFFISIKWLPYDTNQQGSSYSFHYKGN